MAGFQLQIYENKKLTTSPDKHPSCQNLLSANTCSAKEQRHRERYEPLQFIGVPGVYVDDLLETSVPVHRPTQ